MQVGNEHDLQHVRETREADRGQTVYYTGVWERVSTRLSGRRIRRTRNAEQVDYAYWDSSK